MIELSDRHALSVVDHADYGRSVIGHEIEPAGQIMSEVVDQGTGRENGGEERSSDDPQDHLVRKYLVSHFIL